MVKMMIIGRRPGGMTAAQQRHYMQHVHGKMVVDFIHSHPELAPARYVQNHVFDSSFRVPTAVADPFTVSRDFVTQVWFKNPAHAGAAMSAPFYREQLQADEDNFVDQPTVVKLPVLEQERVGSATPVGRSKLFVLYQAADGVSADGLVAATRSLWLALMADGTHGIESVLKNVVVKRPGPALTVDLVDEVWLKDDDTARALGAHLQHLTNGNAELASKLVPASTFVLLAHEHVMFAGTPRA